MPSLSENACRSGGICSIAKLINGNPKINFEFIVVDDASKDGTAVALKKLFGENVYVVSGDGNLYYSGGMRKGIDCAKNREKKYDYILLFNDDVDFYPNSVEHLLDYKSTEDSIIVGATENSLGKLTYGGVRRKSNWRPQFEILMSLPGKRIYCDTFNANCVLIKYSVFMQLDNIDPVYVHSLGDYDYGLNASSKGYRISVSDFFVGTCENNPVSDNWLDKKKSRRERLKMKESIKGLPLKTWFHFVNKNYGVAPAILSTCNQYLKIILNK